MQRFHIHKVKICVVSCVTMSLTFDLCPNVLTWRPAAWHLHVQLHSVHAQDGVTHVAQQVPGRHHASERRKFGQFLKLLFPPEAGSKGQRSKVGDDPNKKKKKKTIG